MATNLRQSELFAGEDWTVLYRAFSSINFNASDPPSINAALRNYIQTNYPEDFNDWIEQSEFVAIIDLLSWIAGNLAFKTDIAVRENFIDTAEARSSILRLARFLSYNASRNLPSIGIVKITSITTNDDVYDSFGTNLNNIPVIWNNPDDANWYERFITIMNNAFITTNPFGIPLISGTVQSIATQLYRINGLVSANHLNFSSTVGGESMAFEICNADFDDGGTLYERPPNPSNAFHIYNLNDSNGNGSARTGFFMLFKQGSTGTQDFIISQPIANQTLDLSAGNINENDIWVQTVDDNGNVLADWTRVPVLLDSNITYNSLPTDQRNIFTDITRDNDQVTLRFSDGLYGNAPSGNIRATYRVSNGESYTMKVGDISGIQIPFTYLNPQGVSKILYLTFSLEESVGNSATAETIQDIQNRAPQVYATQNRMVSGEDYNSFPLQTNLARRIKAVNRTYSGHSRYIDLHDPTGTYQDLSLFEEDGILFKQNAYSYNEIPTSLNYSSSDIVSSFIQTSISSNEMANLVRDIYIYNVRSGNIATPSGVIWNQSQALLYNTTGWFTSTGVFPSQATALILPGSQIQFLMPDGITLQWTSVIEVFSAITTVPTAATNGPVTLTNVIPTGSVIVAIVPRFLASIVPASSLANVVNNLNTKLSFAISYDYLTAGGTWNVIAATTLPDNLSLIGTSITLLTVDYIPGGGNLTGVWRIIGAGIEYVFESVSSVEWFDNGARAIDQSTGQSAKSDTITVLKVNEDRNNPNGKSLGTTYDLTVNEIYFYDDGTVEPRRTTVNFIDSFGYGYPDKPDTYYRIIDNTVDYNSYLFWYTLNGNVIDYPYDSTDTTTSGLLVGYDSDVLMNSDISQAIGTEAFIINSSVSSLQNNTFWTFSTQIIGNATVNIWTQDFSQSFNYAVGRGPNTLGTWITSGMAPNSNTVSNAITNIPFGDEIAFHWKHYAPTDQRIDPSITNIHDIFVLTYSYDTAVRQWIKDGAIAANLPTPPTELDLRLAFASMEDFRMFSDGIVWRPVQYKLLFGTGADSTLQANFKVVRLPNATLSDGEIKSTLITAVNTYFDVSYWDFGETFYYTELAAYIHQQMVGDIASVVIVPLNAAGTFGNDFEIECGPDQIFVSTATVANVQIITSNTPANLRIR